jgi:hypothetical protein
MCASWSIRVTRWYRLPNLGNPLFLFQCHRKIETQLSIMVDGYHATLCGCCSDCAVCCSVCAFGWTLIPSARNWAGSMREPCECCHCCGIASPIWTRANIRVLNGTYASSYCRDAITYLFCFECATCQDARELKRVDQGRIAAVPRLITTQIAYAPVPEPDYADVQPLSYAQPSYAPPSGYGIQPGSGTPPGYPPIQSEGDDMPGYPFAPSGSTRGRQSDPRAFPK